MVYARFSIAMYGPVFITFLEINPIPLILLNSRHLYQSQCAIQPLNHGFLGMFVQFNIGTIGLHHSIDPPYGIYIYIPIKSP